MTTTTKHTDFTLWWRLLRLARSHWLHLVGIFLLSVVSTPLALLTPKPLKIAVDSAIGSEPIPRFIDALLPAIAMRSTNAVPAFAAVLLVAITLFGRLRELGSTLLRTYTSQRLVLNFRADLFGYAQRLSLSYHDLKGRSSSIYRIQYDTSAIQYIAIDGMIPFVTATITLVSIPTIAFQLDWQLALIALAVSPVLFLFVQISRRNLRQRITLARAFLKDAPILALDEPTSSVDLRTEADILEAMDRFAKGRTTL